MANFKIELEDNVPLPIGGRGNAGSTSYDWLKDISPGKSFKVDMKNEAERKEFDNKLRIAIYKHNKDAKLNRDYKQSFIIRTMAFDGAGKPLQYRVWAVEPTRVEVVGA